MGFKESTFMIVLILLLQGLDARADEQKFEKKTIQVGSQKLMVEVANTPEKLQQGLMFRKSLEDGKGMLFIFDDEDTRHFWMKNTFIDLSIGFFDKSKTLVDVQDMKATTSVMSTNLKTYTSKSPATYALEVPLGWFSRKKIKIGDKLKD